MSHGELHYGSRSHRLRLIEPDESSNGARQLVRLHPDDAANRHARLVALHRASLAEDIFRSPAILSFDEPRGASVMEFVEGAQTLALTLPGLTRAAASDLCGRAGRGLSSLHRHFAPTQSQECCLVEAMRHHPAVSLPDTVAGALKESPKVHVHGDFGLGNLMVVPPSCDELWVIDPEIPAFLGVAEAPRTSAYLDLGHFVACLQGIFPLSEYRRFDWGGLPAMQAAFLEGYASTAGWNPDASIVAYVAAWNLDCFVTHGRSSLRRIRSLPHRWWLRRRARTLIRSSQ